MVDYLLRSRKFIERRKALLLHAPEGASAASTLALAGRLPLRLQPQGPEWDVETKKSPLFEGQS